MIGNIGIMIALKALLIWLGFANPCALLAAEKAPVSLIKPEFTCGMLIDLSQHQKKVIGFERQALDSVRSKMDGLVSEAFFMKYGDRIDLLQDWTGLEGGPEKIHRQIEVDSESRSGKTLLYDGLDAGIEKLKAKANSGSKILIVIGEGNDSGSIARYAEVKKLAQSANVRCFALLVADHNLRGGRVRHFGFYLYDLTKATRGAGFDIEASNKRLDKAVGKILERIQFDRQKSQDR